MDLPIPDQLECLELEYADLLVERDKLMAEVLRLERECEELHAALEKYQQAETVVNDVPSTLPRHG